MSVVLALVLVLVDNYGVDDGNGLDGVGGVDGVGVGW